MADQKQSALEKKAQAAANEGVKASASLVEQIKGLQIRSAADAQNAADLQKKIRVQWKVWEDARVKIVKPAGDSIAAANDFFKRDPGPLGILEVAGKLLKEKLTRWSLAEKEKERIRQEKEERAAEAIRLKEQEEADALREQAEALEEDEPDKAQALHQEAEEKLETAATTVAKPVKKAAIPTGFHTRDNWTFDVYDIEKLILGAAEQISTVKPHEGIDLTALLLANEKMLGDLAKTTKGNMEIPGVKIFNKPVGVGS